MSGMTCDEAEPLLPLVADGALDADADPALFAHLSRCPSCQDALARHDLVDLALRRGLAEHPARRPLHLRPWVPMAVAAALVLAIGGAAAVAWPRPSGQVDVVASRPAVRPAAVAADPAMPEIWRVPGQKGRYLIVNPDGSTMVVDPLEGDAGAPGAQAPTMTVGW